MVQLAALPGFAGLGVSLLLGLATHLPPAHGKGRAFWHLTPREEVECPGASLEAFLNSTVTTVLLPTLYSVVLLVGLPANVLACWVLAKNFGRCSSSLFLLNLATADLLFILLLPFKISYHLLGNHWLFGDYLCRTMVALFYGNMYTSILFLTCIGVERYVSTEHISKLNITTCHDVQGKDKFFQHYFLCLVGLGFGVPFVLMIISHSCILARNVLLFMHYLQQDTGCNNVTYSCEQSQL
ncbi:hypothetical protein ASZ78_007362 [Callipepla squamata]|uniref:G-protein coupled receptors family 1 profile domain-containing protein n=1 Tax=Callipepla squamata TaxID=9009 RepID=A0A226NCH5_CALSU|nr:hypothetical protein ASZ78_007362 [Callipepla squamata]